MSNTWRFRSEVGSLRQCDDVLEKMLNRDGDSTPDCPLCEYEIRAAHELIQRCGIILGRVFEGFEDRNEKLCEFVFEAASGFAEEVVDEANKHFLKIAHDKQDADDAEFEKSLAMQKLAEERVDRGIQWLENRSDLGTWEAAIYRQTLDMRHPCKCIGGSIFGDDDDPIEGPNGYTRLCEHLKAEGLSPIDLGFQTDGRVTLKVLQAEWIRRVEARR